MKNLIKILSVAALLTSCAYENDPGLKPKGTEGKVQVKDSLAGKTGPEVLKLKYKSVVANCKLEAKTAPAAVQAAEPLAVEPTPPATAPVTYPKEDTVIFDLKLQAAADPALTAPVSAKLVNTIDGHVVTVELKLKPEFVDLTLPMDKMIYFMKHSPQISYEYTFSVANGKDLFVGEPSKGSINEKVEISRKVGHSKITVGDVTTDRDHTLTCVLATEINADSADKDEFASQYDSIDCSQTPVKGKEELYKTNCKPTAP